MMNLYEVARFLEAHDNYDILTHAYPDGDTLGSGFALCLALRQIGKKARVITTGVPSKFTYLQKNIEEDYFTTETVVSVDVAADSLLGSNMGKYIGKVDLCIDHHGSNTFTAKEKFVDKYAAANCEILYKLFLRMHINFTKDIADCLYTGISTDTGCFRYTNTTAETMRVAASLMDFGCNTAYINKAMFETKSKNKIQLERAVYDSMTYCADGRCAIIYTTLDMLKKLNTGDDEMEGLASIPRQIEGVLIGITMREKEGGFFKISVRTNNNINASDFCSQFGGGGHPAAAGCSIEGDLETVKTTLEKAAEKLEEFFDQFRLGMEQQERLLGVYGEEREELEKVIEIENRLGEARNLVSQKQIEAMANEELALERKLQREQEIYELGSQNVENLLMTIVDGTSSIEDAFKAMLASIIREIYQNYVAKGAADVAGNFLVSLFSAKGNAFGTGGVKMFANGGVVDSPTLFNYSGGTGMMGEAGPEAIMPLKRNSQGKLGVQVSGGSSGNVSIQQHFYISANGDESVRSIIRQEMPNIANAAKAAVIEGKRRNEKGL